VQIEQISNEQRRPKKHHTRAHALHTELPKVCMDEFNKVPDVRVTHFNPILREIYNLAEACEEKRERHRMRQQNEQLLSLSHKTMSAKQGTQNRSSTRPLATPKQAQRTVIMLILFHLFFPL
jgi:hypothetical protein